jgi:hypothetical protein
MALSWSPVTSGWEFTLFVSIGGWDTGCLFWSLICSSGSFRCRNCIPSFHHWHVQQEFPRLASMDMNKISFLGAAVNWECWLTRCQIFPDSCCNSFCHFERRYGASELVEGAVGGFKLRGSNPQEPTYTITSDLLCALRMSNNDIMDIRLLSI